MNSIKKIGLLFSIVSVMAMIFTACSSEIERDADMMIQREIEYRETNIRFLDRSNLHGKPMSRQELEAYNREYEEFCNQMMAKYSQTPEMRDEFKQLLNEKRNK